MTPSRYAAPSSQPEPEFIPSASEPLADSTSILASPEAWEGDTIVGTPTTSSAFTFNREPSGSAPLTTDSTPGTALPDETRGRRRVHWPPDDKLYDIRLVSPRRLTS